MVFLAINRTNRALGLCAALLLLGTAPAVLAQSADQLLTDGIEQTEAEDYAAAAAALSEALSLYQAQNNRVGTVQTYIALGNLYAAQGNAAAAEQAYLAGLAAAESDPKLSVAVINQLYPFLSGDRATELLEAGVTLAQAANDPLSQVGYLLNLRDLYFAANDFDALLSVADRFQAMVDALLGDSSNPELELYADLMYASAYAVSSDAESVYTYTDRAIAAAEQVYSSQPDSLIPVYEIAVFIYDKLPDYDRGIALLERAIDQSTDATKTTLYYALLGRFHEAINQFEAAEAASNAALELATDEMLEVKVIALTTLGEVYDQRGDYTTAVTTANAALDLARSLDNDLLEAYALAVLASAYSSLGNYEQAIAAAETSLAIAEAENDLNVMLGVLGTLYGSYLDLGDFDRASQLADEMLARVRTSNPDSQNLVPIITAFGGLFDAVGYFVDSDYQNTVTTAEATLAALPELRAADEIKSLLSGFLFLFAGIGYSGLNQHPAAIAAVTTGLETVRASEFSSLDGDMLFFAGNIHYRAGNLDQALAYYTEALALEPSYYARTGVARLYRDQNLPNVAISYYKQAINQIEQVRGNVRSVSSGLEESFFQAFVSIDGLRVADVYRELADLLLSQGRIAEAQQVLELLKLEELREYQGLERSGQQSDIALNPTEQQIVEQYGSLIAFGQEVLACQQTRCPDLSRLLDQRDQLTTDFNATVQTLEANIQERLAVDRGALDTQDFRRSAAQIVEAQPGTLLIYPLVLEDKLWILWAAEGGVLNSVEVDTVSQRQLSETVLRFRQLLETPTSSVAEIKTVGKQLYDWLLGPLEAEIQENNITNLVFALDRTTRYLPMAALYDGSAYLVENYTTSTILSAGETDMSDRLTPSASVLALGLANAVEGFSALPNVPAELDSIVIEASGDDTGVYPGQLFLNENFDRRTLRDNLAFHSIAHIATHAEFVPGSHADSYLMLGSGDPLKISDIQTLQDLSNIHLIVLSACETALSGPDQDGIEISGVAHQFLSGGAKAVIASLWKVNDASTSLLMQLFYQQLANSDTVTKTAALREAQLTLLNNSEDMQLALATLARSGERFGNFDPTFTARRPEGYAHPYYWAPFILIGNTL